MDSEFITVVPAEGFTPINDLTMQPVPKEGVRVRRSIYWNRMINEGAVTVKDDEEKPEAPEEDK